MGLNQQRTRLLPRQRSNRSGVCVPPLPAEPPPFNSGASAVTSSPLLVFVPGPGPLEPGVKLRSHGVPTMARRGSAPGTCLSHFSGRVLPPPLCAGVPAPLCASVLAPLCAGVPAPTPLARAAPPAQTPAGQEVALKRAWAPLSLPGEGKEEIGKVTFGELRQKVALFAAAMRRMGMRAGDRVVGECSGHLSGLWGEAEAEGVARGSGRLWSNAGVTSWPSVARAQQKQPGKADG